MRENTGFSPEAHFQTALPGTLRFAGIRFDDMMQYQAQLAPPVRVRQQRRVTLPLRKLFPSIHRRTIFSFPRRSSPRFTGHSVIPLILSRAKIPLAHSGDRMTHSVLKATRFVSGRAWRMY